MRKRLIELIKEMEKHPEITCPKPDDVEACKTCQYAIGEFMCDSVARKADHLLANGVLPCKVGSTIYRIDEKSKKCSYENEYYDEFYCRNCRIRLNGDCDAGKEPYIFVIKDANAQAILGNAHLFGSRAFLSLEEAEKALAERSGG